MITYSLNEFTNYHTMTYPPHVMLYAPDYMRHNPTHPLDQVCKLNWSPDWAQLQTVCVCVCSRCASVAAIPCITIAP